LANLFGFEIKRINKDEELPSPIGKEEDDGAVVIDTADGAYSIGLFNSFYNAADKEASDEELITEYRNMSLVPEIEEAIDDILNEMISTEDNHDLVDINLDETDLPENIKKKIIEEFNEILSLLDFNNNAYEIIKNWYVDGRINYQLLVENDNVKNGINELRYIDPRLIRKIKEVKKKIEKGVEVQEPAETYYLLSNAFMNNKKGGVQKKDAAIKLSKDSVVQITSGIMNHDRKKVLSHLDKARVPLNMLKALETSSIIYQVSRAPERRIFYIDVGNLPRAKAEQHLRDVATLYKNKLGYDQSTGKVKDDRLIQTLSQDYFLPRRSDGKATEISTLPGGSGQQGMLEILDLFKQKLQRALNVPMSRLEQGMGMQLGRQTEISRDELKFAKFITRLRKRFSGLFTEILKRQLVMKNIITAEEFDEIASYIEYKYSTDNLIAENKNQEIIQGRLNIMRDIENYVGKYFSMDYVRKNILNMSDEDIAEEKKKIEEEKKSGEISDEDEDDNRRRF
jgi:hypothetical protein